MTTTNKILYKFFFYLTEWFSQHILAEYSLDIHFGKYFLNKMYCLYFTQCKVIQILESRKHFARGNQKIFPCGIHEPSLWGPEFRKTHLLEFGIHWGGILSLHHGIRNPLSWNHESSTWGLESTYHIMESKSWNPHHGIRNPVPEVLSPHNGIQKPVPEVLSPHNGIHIMESRIQNLRYRVHN